MDQTASNRVVLFGNLDADPELRKLPDGQSFLKMRLVTNHSFVNREGVREERLEHYAVTLWGSRSEGLSRVLSKGSFLLVEGHLCLDDSKATQRQPSRTEVLAHNVVLGGRCDPEKDEKVGS